jgi:hypothetical protein
MSQYEDTRELIEDLDNEIDDAFYTWQDNNYEEFVYEIELRLEIKDDKLRRLEYYLNKVDDDVFHRTESFLLL